MRNARSMGSTPAATAAAYSPREWPATTFGASPRSAKTRSKATSVASTAGWVTVVCMSAMAAAPAGASSFREVFPKM